VNASRAGDFYYTDVRLATSVGNTRYQLNVTTSAVAKR
jgi:hypothetical protein